MYNGFRMMVSVSYMYRLLMLLYLTTSVANAIKRYYATESCGHVHGPDHLTVIEFDKEVDYIKNKPSDEQNLIPPLEIRNTVWDCVIVVRGMPSLSKRYIGVQWRSFHIRDPDIHTVEESVEDCGKTYVTMYRGSDISAPVVRTMCGKDATKTLFEWEGSFVTFRFFADFRRNESLIPPDTTSDEAADVPSCVDPSTIEDGAVTSLPLCTTQKKNKATTTPIDTYPYPEVHFRVDITSFDYNCTETVKNEMLKCNDSQRCINWDLLCDYYFSHNCKSPTFPDDKSDQTRDAPSYCFRKTTTTPIPTTTIPPPPPPFNWMPIAASVGGVLAAMTICWCCCRPAYLPWRLSRLRNVPLFRDTLTCICCRGPSKCCKCCDQGGFDEIDYAGFGPGAKYKRRSLSTRGAMMLPMALGKSPWGKRLKNSGIANLNRFAKVSNAYPPRPKLHPAQEYGKDPNNFASDWLSIISGDGGHLREHR